jgi:voltage-gated sodium channel
VPFIIVTSFAVLNLFIALIVNSMQSMQSETNEHVRAEALAAHDEREALSRQIEALIAEVRQMRETMRKD